MKIKFYCENCNKLVDSMREVNVGGFEYRMDNNGNYYISKHLYTDEVFVFAMSVVRRVITHYRIYSFCLMVVGKWFKGENLQR